MYRGEHHDTQIDAPMSSRISMTCYTTMLFYILLICIVCSNTMSIIKLDAEDSPLFVR